MGLAGFSGWVFWCSGTGTANKVLAALGCWLLKVGRNMVKSDRGLWDWQDFLDRCFWNLRDKEGYLELWCIVFAVTANF